MIDGAANDCSDPQPRAPAEQSTAFIVRLRGEVASISTVVPLAPPIPADADAVVCVIARHGVSCHAVAGILHGLADRISERAELFEDQPEVRQ